MRKPLPENVRSHGSDIYTVECQGKEPGEALAEFKLAIGWPHKVERFAIYPYDNDFHIVVVVSLPTGCSLSCPPGGS